MAQPNPTQTVTNPRIAKLIELEVAGRIKPEHQLELDGYRAKGWAPKKSSGNSLTEYQGKSTGFYERATGADKDFIAAGEGGSPVGLAGDAARAVLPTGIVNSLTSGARQKAEQAKEDWIRASLRYESGAAISPTEFEGQDRIFFPQTGDSDEVIKQKAASRQRVAESLKVAAGPGVDNKPKDVTVAGAAAIDAAIDKAAGVDYRSDEEKDLEHNLGRKPGEPLRVTIRPDAAPLKERGEGGVAEGADTVVRGIADTATLGFADELAAAGDTIFGDGTMADNLRHQRGIDRYDAENSPWLRGAGQLAGAAAPVGVGRIGMGARGARDLAVTGGGLGAAYGFGSGDTLQDRFIGAGKGGVAGAATGLVLGKLSDLYMRRGGGGSGGGAPDTIRDVGNRLGIEPTPATTGGPFSEGMQYGLGNLPGSLGPIRNAVDAETQGITDAARRVADSIGPVRTPAEAGATIARGARVADRVAGREASRTYQARDAMMGGDTAPVTMGGTQAAIGNIAGDFRSNEVVAQMLQHPLVRRLEAADANELTLGESTELLSEARRVLRQAQQSKQPGRLINQLRSLEGAIEGDVRRAAQASDAIVGRAADQGAAAAQTRADRLWADRMQAQRQELKKPLASFTDEVNTSAESVYRQMFNDMNEQGGNLVRLRRTVDRLPRRARDTFAATVFDDMGRAVDSAQNAAGDVWSFDTFMTNWAKKSDDAKRLVLGGRGVDRDINDIVRYAERLKEVGRSRNFSGTGRQIANSGFAASLASAFTGATAATGSLSAGLGAAAAVASTYPVLNIAARSFLGVPAARQWLRSAMSAAVRGNDSQARNLVRRLPALASQHPAIRNEIIEVQNMILGAANDNIGGATRAAASGEGPDDGEQR